MISGMKHNCQGLIPIITQSIARRKILLPPGNDSLIGMFMMYPAGVGIRKRPFLMTDDFPVLIFQRQFPYGKKAVGKGSIVRRSRQPVGEDADDIIAAGLGVFLHFCDEWKYRENSYKLASVICRQFLTKGAWFSGQSKYPYNAYEGRRRCCSRRPPPCRYGTAIHGNSRTVPRNTRDGAVSHSPGYPRSE